MGVILTIAIAVTRTIFLDLKPKDYLYCDTEEELKRNVENDLRSSKDFAYLDTDEIEELDYALDIPDKFIKEWNILKAASENQESN